MPEKTVEISDSAAVIVFQGDDALTIQDLLTGLISRCQDGGWGAMNTVQLDGMTVAPGDFNTAINVLPLGGSTRLVILRDALEFSGNKDSREYLTRAIENLPDTSTLVLVFTDSQKYRKGEMVWQAAAGNHWLRKALKNSGRETQWLEFPLPSRREMPGWISKEAEAQGGKFEGAAAAELARLIGENTLQARQEIAKALSYSGSGNPVTRADVRLLCPLSTEEKIFTLVDAVGKRDARGAMALLQRMLIDFPIQYIFSMVARQIRQLIIAKEMLASGGNVEAIQSATGVPHFAAKKLAGQCRNFQIEELERIYRRLDRMDEESKTGRGKLEVSLECLIADISRK
jgi:DNA polymerase-3 subunit delta